MRAPGFTDVTPLDAAFTKPVAAEHLGSMLSAKNIELVTEFNTGEVDGSGGRLISYDGREVAFDLAVVVPIDTTVTTTLAAAATCHISIGAPSHSPRLTQKGPLVSVGSPRSRLHSANGRFSSVWELVTRRRAGDQLPVCNPANLFLEGLVLRRLLDDFL